MKRLNELYSGQCKVWTDGENNGHGFVIPGYRDYSSHRLRINVLAMGDVGGTMTLAMRLTGADIISRIGICDISETAIRRWEQELNQIALPSDPEALPPVIPVEAEELFDCDVFVFCASRGVPDLSQKDVDVRMVQLDKNRELIRSYAAQAVEAGFDGEFFVVSDPVDPLCRAAASGGILPERIQGFGLGVMNGRAAYFARQAKTEAGKSMPAVVKYLTEGRVYGPHGEDLVVANSIADYDEEASLELTRQTVSANLRIRELGFKPYIAPAVTSGALSIMENLRGHWHYSSAWFGPAGEVPEEGGGAYLGMRNRRCGEGLLIEDPSLDDRLFERIERAYRNLEELR